MEDMLAVYTRPRVLLQTLAHGRESVKIGAIKRGGGDAQDQK
jgi:hypothetical protein